MYTITLTLGALVLALIAFGVGRVAGRRTQRQERAILVLGGIALTLAALFAFGVRAVAKTVNGPFIVWVTVLLLAMIVLGMVGGFTSALAARKSNGPRRVARMSAVTLLGELVLAGLLYALAAPVIAQANEIGVLDKTEKYEPETNKACPENLKSLYNALTLYAQNYDGALPPAANWLDNSELTGYVTKNEWLHCPAVSNRSDNHYGYAYNESVAGKKIKTIPDPAHTPLIYDSTNLDKSAHDERTSLPVPGRHSGRNNILFCDGHVEAVAPKK